MFLLRNIFLLFFMFWSMHSVAADAQLGQARINIQKYLADVPDNNIQRSPIKGFYQVSMPPRIFYLTEDGQFAFDGDVIDLKNNKNLTQIERQKGMVVAIDNMGEDTMIVFKADKPQHTISVFTDIDCGYCRKLHNAVPEYNKLGITVRYLAFPRAGPGSESYKKAVSVWCADDRRTAMTKAKSGIPLDKRNCDNPVTQHYQLGNRVGVTGTPAIAMENGRLLPGFVPPARLSAILNKSLAKK